MVEKASTSVAAQGPTRSSHSFESFALGDRRVNKWLIFNI
jgi:hypothetical protein